VELFKCQNEEDLFMNYMKSYRRQIKRAIKDNVLSIKEGTTLEEYERLYEIYKKISHYWAENISAIYSFDFFQNIFSLKSKHVKFWVIYYKDKMIGGDITLFWNGYCHSLKSFHDREYSKLYTRRYLEHNIFLFCKEEGIKYYDFLQSGGLKGVEFFKRSMGAKDYPHSAWVKEKPVLKKIAEMKRNVVSPYRKIV
jgi:lipid II:glycine glycyltransferase (peptidoglycan interpeptide bridge formation enzyme)